MRALDANRGEIVTAKTCALSKKEESGMSTANVLGWDPRLRTSLVTGNLGGREIVN
jgi:hypothetical protein